jgi:hypothetical protein
MNGAHAMQSKAATVAQYLAELPADRRQEVEQVRAVIKHNLGPGYEEGMQYGMIGFYVPHSIYPAGYHCDPKQPLPFAGLASQKNHLSLYCMSMYDEGEDLSWFHKEWKKTGKKLDMGKCCIRFKRAADLALDVIGEAIKRMPVERWVKFYESTIHPMVSRKRTAKGTKKAIKPNPVPKRPDKPVAKKKKSARTQRKKT